MKKVLFLIFNLYHIISVNAQSIIKLEKIDSFVYYNGAANFKWDKASNTLVWSALQQTDKVLAVSYKPTKNSTMEEVLPTFQAQKQDWQKAKKDLIKLVFESEKKVNPKLTLLEVEAYKSDDLPVLYFKIENIETIERIKENQYFSELDAIGYLPTLDRFEKFINKKLSTSLLPDLWVGCYPYAPNFNLQVSTDYTNITPNSKYSWNFSYNKIQETWNKGFNGSGQNILVIDTGVSNNQDNLGTNFNQGLSTGRTITKKPLLDNRDICGHGTCMAGLATGPRGTDSNSSGIAYKANLTSYKTGNDVLLSNTTQIINVVSAINYFKSTPNLKIASMSMGAALPKIPIALAISTLNINDKILFCAAGTSTAITSGYGVIFPANMTKVTAVTGIKSDINNFQKCTQCHMGNKVDFVAVVEHINSGQSAITLSKQNTNQPTTVGNSSCATAMYAGMAALIWQKYPGYNATQIIQKIKDNSTHGNNRHPNFGWGLLNVDNAWFFHKLLVD